MYIQAIRPDELYHHGIKGQKWGVRRFQNYDGTLKNKSAKARHAKQAQKYTPPKTKLGKKIEDKLVSKYSKKYKELSEQEIRDRVARRNKTMRNVLIGAGAATATAAAIYAYRKYGREVADSMIRTGTEIHALADNPDRINAGKAVYAAVNKRDTARYRALFGDSVGGLKYDNTGKVGKSIKVAGNKNAEKIFNKMMTDDKEFADGVKTFVDQRNFLALGPKMKADYKNFNTYALLGADIDYKENPAAKNIQEIRDKFYGELKNRGYGAVADINDTKYSEFNTKAAIIFDRNNIAVKPATDVKRLTAEQVRKAKAAVVRQSLIDIASHPRIVGTGATYAYLFGFSKAHKKAERSMNELNNQRVNQKKKK